MERRLVSLIVCAIAVAGNLLAQPPAQSAPPGQSLPPQQLDNLVAPIALYPDPLLGQVLAASTYPLELVEAHQWLQTVGILSGQQLMDAARQQNWDPSVQALVAMPDVMNLLTQDVRWTTDLGNAFLAQQADVMSAVQRMRQRAQANGQLRSNPQETVTTQNQDGQQAIEIQPSNPQELYVPAYDPYYVYGYGAYPPLYYPDGYWFEPGINVGLYFGGWGGWGFGGWGWGWGPNWFGRSVFINSGFFNRYGFRHGAGFAGGFAGRTNWVHDPAHRLGAGYSNGQLTSRFGAASQASRIAAGRAGNWRSFSGSNTATRNSFAGSVQQRSFQQGSGPRFQAPASRNFQSAPAQRFESPSRNFQAPAQRSAPAFQAPQRGFQAAPQAAARMSAPSAPRSFGGGARSFGGGGGVSHNSGGGGGSHGGGGGSHGGGRR